MHNEGQLGKGRDHLHAAQGAASSVSLVHDSMQGCELSANPGPLFSLHTPALGILPNITGREHPADSATAVGAHLRPPPRSP